MSLSLICQDRSSGLVCVILVVLIIRKHASLWLLALFFRHKGKISNMTQADGHVQYAKNVYMVIVSCCANVVILKKPQYICWCWRIVIAVVMSLYNDCWKTVAGNGAAGNHSYMYRRSLWSYRVLLMCFCHNSSVSVRDAWWDSAGIMYTAINQFCSEWWLFNKFAASEVWLLQRDCILHHIQLNRKLLLVEKKKRQKDSSKATERKTLNGGGREIAFYAEPGRP